MARSGNVPKIKSNHPRFAEKDEPNGRREQEIEKKTMADVVDDCCSGISLV